MLSKKNRTDLKKYLQKLDRKIGSDQFLLCSSDETYCKHRCNSLYKIWKSFMTPACEGVYPRRGVVEQQRGENDPAHLLHTVFTSY